MTTAVFGLSLNGSPARPAAPQRGAVGQGWSSNCIPCNSHSRRHARRARRQVDESASQSPSGTSSDAPMEMSVSPAEDPSVQHKRRIDAVIEARLDSWRQCEARSSRLLAAPGSTERSLSVVEPRFFTWMRAELSRSQVPLCLVW